MAPVAILDCVSDPASFSHGCTLSPVTRFRQESPAFCKAPLPLRAMISKETDSAGIASEHGLEAHSGEVSTIVQQSCMEIGEEDRKFCMGVCTEDWSECENRDEPSVMIEAIRSLLEELGEDVDRDGLRRTPLRVARAFRSATKGYQQTVSDIIGEALFSEAPAGNGLGCGGGAGGMVVVRDVDLFSCCKGCLLPFKVRCHIAYVPSSQRVIGLSKLPRIAEAYARRLQTPEGLALQLVQVIADSFNPLGVAVAIESWHLANLEQLAGTGSFQNFGLEKAVGWQAVHGNSGSKLAGAVAGAFMNSNGLLWREFLALLHLDEDDCVLCGTDVDECASPSPFRQECRQQGLVCPYSASSLDQTKSYGHWNCCSGGDQSKAEGAAARAVKVLVSELGGKQVDEEELTLAAKRYTNFLFEATRGSHIPLGFLKEPFVCEGNSIDLRQPLDMRKQAATVVSLRLQKTMAKENELIQRDLHIYEPVLATTLCEHHLLPFFGVIHVALVPANADFLGWQTLAGIIQLYSRRLQVQERLTRQVAEGVAELLPCLGVIVVMEASHMCMVSRGIEKVASSTSTVASLGCFSDIPELRTTFMRHLRKRN